MSLSEFIYLGLAIYSFFLTLMLVAAVIGYKRVERERLELVIKNAELKLLLKLWE